MWDSVPWMVGGGAEHSTNVARNVAFAAFGGREGIVRPKDLEVRELDVPGSSVRVSPGTCAILNRAAGSQDEMYVGRHPSESTVNIAATDATGARHDLILARVENPYLGGEPWNDPADPKVGPYIFTRVENVPAGTKTVEELGLGYTAIPLARIDIPASTGTITQAMITDLRFLSQPRVERFWNMIAPTVQNKLTSAQYTNWPAEANMTVDVPSWATHVKTRAILAGLRFGATGSNGGAGWGTSGWLRIQFGGATYTQGTKYNESTDAGEDRATVMCGGPAMKIPEGDRGRAVSVRIEGLKSDGTTSLFSDEGSMLSLEVEFTNAAESSL